MAHRAARWWSDESGQSLVEYVLLIALVAITLIAVLLLLRGAIGSPINGVTQEINSAPDGCKNPVPAVQNPNCG